VTEPDARPFERTLAALAAALDGAGIPYMVIGGVAVLVHGVPRLTRDIDVTVLLPVSDVARLREALGPGFATLVDDPESFVEETRVLPVRAADGTRVDLIFAGLPFEEEAIGRAKPEELGSATVKVCAPEDLILHKILSSRPRDLEDVEGIVRARGDTLDRERLDRVIRALAVDLESPEILDFWRGLWRE
jgi:hypothetical protein